MGRRDTSLPDFVSLPNLSKLGMGIAFFPTAPATPPTVLNCTDDTQCGPTGPVCPS